MIDIGRPGHFRPFGALLSDVVPTEDETEATDRFIADTLQMLHRQTTEKPIRWWHLKTRMTRWAQEQMIDPVVSSLARQMQRRRWD